MHALKICCLLMFSFLFFMPAKSHDRHKPGKEVGKPVFFSCQIMSESIKKESFYVSYYRDQNLYSGKGFSSLSFKANDKGSFNINLPAIDGLRKLTFRINGTIFYEYIAEPGDNIQMKISQENDNTDILFSGKGSAKYRCRREIEKEIDRWNDVRTKLMGVLWDSIAGTDKSLDRAAIEKKLINQQNIDRLFGPYKNAKENILSVLDKYKKSVSPLIYQVMKADAYGRLGSIWQIQMSHLFKAEDLKSPEERNNAIRLQEQYGAAFIGNFPDEVTAVSEDLVNGYLSNIMFKSLLKASLASGKNGYSFRRMYDILKNENTGRLRESLLTTWLVSPLYKTPELVEDSQDVDACVLDAWSFVKTPVLKAVIGPLRARTKGVDAYKFSLPDTAGRIVKLENLKGKVVLQDFWFTNCTGCKMFAKKFKEDIYPEFKDNKDFVVVSVNTDKKKELWLESLNKGWYSEKEYINVYTEGLGFNDHPMIKHYSLMGAPYVLLIDKNGKIFYQVPANADSKSIISMIKEALAQQ